MITANELRNALVAFGHKEATEAEVADVVAEADPTGIDFSDFLQLMAKKMKDTDSGDEGLIEAFKSFDKSGNGEF